MICYAISAGCTNALILIAELHYSRKSPVVRLMSLFLEFITFHAYMFFCTFHPCNMKRLFCYGICNKNGVCSKVPMSDVKDYGTIDITLAFAAEILL